MIDATYQTGELVTGDYPYNQTASQPEGCWVIVFQDTDRGLATIAYISGTYEIDRHGSLNERVLIERASVDRLRPWTGERPWWAADIADILGVEIPFWKDARPEGR